MFVKTWGKSFSLGVLINVFPGTLSHRLTIAIGFVSDPLTEGPREVPVVRYKKRAQSKGCEADECLRGVRYDYKNCNCTVLLTFNFPNHSGRWLLSSPILQMRTLRYAK